MKPTTKADWDQQEALEHAVLHVPPSPPLCLARCRSEQEVVEDNVRWLIEHLYQPDAEVGWCFRGTYLVHAGVPNIEAVAQEPVNWGDLDVVEVVMHGDRWQVTLEEAAAGDCPALCEYVRGWLQSWGWTAVFVQTTW